MYYNARSLIIHPLPERFGQSFHIIFETKIDKEILDEERLNNQSFIASNETESSIDSKKRGSNIGRHRRCITSNSDQNIPHVLYIETAIFVDKDLFRHMAKNFPKNTEENLIRFVMAMINCVCDTILIEKFEIKLKINFIGMKIRFSYFIIIHHWVIKLILY